MIKFGSQNFEFESTIGVTVKFDDVITVVFYNEQNEDHEQNVTPYSETYPILFQVDRSAELMFHQSLFTLDSIWRSD